MIYNEYVQGVLAKGWTIDQVMDSAVSQYNEAISKGYDRQAVRESTKRIYGLSTGTTKDDVDDAQWLASLLFAPAEPDTKTQQSAKKPEKQLKAVSSPLEALTAGFDSSTLGMWVNSAVPDKAISPDASLFSKVLYQGAQMVGDLPAMIVGGAIGGATGTAAGATLGPGAAITGLIGSAAGAGFTTEYLRNALMRSYSEGKSVDGWGFFSNLVDDFVAGGKGAAIGVTAAGAGKLAAPMISGAVSKVLAPGTVSHTLASGTAELAVDAAVLTGATSAIAGQLPTAEDFIVNGVTCGGFKVAGLYTKKYIQGSLKDQLEARRADKQAEQQIADELQQQRLEIIEAEGQRKLKGKSELDQEYIKEETERLKAEAQADPTEFVDVNTNFYVKKFEDHYVHTGESPTQVSQRTSIDPEIRDRVLAVNQPIANAEKTDAWTMYVPVDMGLQSAPFDPIDAAGKWTYASEFKAQDRAIKQAEQRYPKETKETKPDPKALVHQIGISKKGTYIRLEGNADAVTSEVINEYAKPTKHQQQLLEQNPDKTMREIILAEPTKNQQEILSIEPNFYDQNGKPVKQLVPSASRKLFENPSANLAYFLQSHPWSNEQAGKLARNSSLFTSRVEGSPIRWSGIIAHDAKNGFRIMPFERSKLQYSLSEKPAHGDYETAQMKIAKVVSIDEHDGYSAMEKIDNAIYNFSDSLAGFDIGAKKGLHSKSYVQATTALGADGVSKYMLDYGMINASKEKVGPSFKAIIQDTINAGGDPYELKIYLAAKTLDVKHRQNIKTGADPADVKTILSGKNAAIYEEANKKLIAYNDGLLSYAFERGLISKRKLDELRRERHGALPLEKLAEAFSVSIEGLTETKGSTLEKLVELLSAGDKPLDAERLYNDPLESLVRQTQFIVRLAEQNETKRIAAKEEYGIAPDKTGSILKAPKTQTISYLENGQQKSAIVPEEVARAARTMTREQFRAYNVILSGLGKFTGLFRVGSTSLNPAFAVKQILMDNITAYIQSPADVKFRPFLDAFVGLNEILKTKVLGKESLYTEWLKDGGSMSSVYSLTRNCTQEVIHDIQRVPVKNLIAHPLNHINLKNLQYAISPFSWLKAGWDATTGTGRFGLRCLQEIAEVSDQMTRVGVYAAAKRSGRTGIDAAFLSRRSTIDFARAGATIHGINSIIAFLNARVQGTVRIFETAKTDPIDFLSKVTTGVLVPATMLALVRNSFIQNHSDPNDPMYGMAEELKELPDWERIGYYHIPVPRLGSVLRIAKPQELAILTAFPEAFVDWATRKNPANTYLDTLVGNGFISGVYDTLIPNVIPTPLVGPTEVITNYSFFTGQNIIPSHLSQVVPPLQYKPGTSTTARAISNVLFKICPDMTTNAMTRLFSPLGIDHIIRSWTGQAGVTVVKAIDKILEASGTYERPQQVHSIEDMPFFKSFMVKYPNIGAKSITEFNNKAKALQQRYNSVLAGAKSLDPHAREIAQSILASQPVANFTKAFTAFSRIMQVINALDYSPDIDPQTRQYQKEKLLLQLTALARGGLAIIEQIEEATNARRQ